jgi:hypothetical protein
MPRSSVREDLQRRLRDHLAVAQTHLPEECPLDVRGVAAALGISPTTLYKYGFNREINAAEQRQRDSGIASGTAIENQYYHDQVRALTQEIEKERERSKGLVGRIAIMEANAARLGFDPEEMHKPILKPVQTTSWAGTGKPSRHRRQF